MLEWTVSCLKKKREARERELTHSVRISRWTVSMLNPKLGEMKARADGRGRGDSFLKPPYVHQFVESITSYVLYWGTLAPS